MSYAGSAPGCSWWFVFWFAGNSCISPLRGSMCNYHDYHAEEMEDDYDYDMDDPVDDMVDEHQEREFRDSDSDDDDYVRSVCFPFYFVTFCGVHFLLGE